MSGIGVVLPMALARSGDGGAYTLNKAGGFAWAMKEFCPDAIQEDKFYGFDGFAYDWATELHRAPSAMTCGAGPVAYLDHFRGQVCLIGRVQVSTVRFVSLFFTRCAGRSKLM